LNIIKNANDSDNNTSIGLIEDECNMYTMLIAKRVKRIRDRKIDLVRCCASEVRSKDKALLCWVTKKSPYIVPINNPRIKDSIIN
jgi:hypothetical protein